MLMTEQVVFKDDPDVRDTDDENFVELIFYTRHRKGGSSKASMLVPRNLAREEWAIQRARTAGAAACTKAGGGGAMCVTISDGW